MNSALRDVDRGGEDRAVWIHPGTDPTLTDGDLVEVRRGGASIRAAVRVTTDIVLGAVSIPHGLADQNVNELTSARRGDVDPLTGMITQSGFPVTLARVQAENAGITS